MQPFYIGEPMSIIRPLISSNKSLPLWQWEAFPYPLIEKTAINELRIRGYKRITEGPDLYKRLQLMMSQCCEPEYIFDGTLHVQARSKDIQHIIDYPITLAFLLKDAPKPDDKKITMLQFLPYPGLGEWAQVAEGEGRGQLYHISQLPQKAQLLQERMKQILFWLAGESQWINHTEFHAECADKTNCQEIRAILQSDIQQATGQEKKNAQRMLAQFELAARHVDALLKSWSQPGWLVIWQQLKEAAKELAEEYWYYHQICLTPEEKHTVILPRMTSSQQTRIPSTNGFRGLLQSFGPGLQPELWNTELSEELRLSTPNHSLLKVIAQAPSERKALQYYIIEEMGVEGLKHLVMLLDAYYAQTHGEDRKIDALISPRQLLQRAGYNESKVDDKEEQLKFLHTILYLARTWIVSEETRSSSGEKPRRGPRRSQSIEYSPLIVLETLRTSKEGGIEIPEAVEFHLGKEFYEILFGDRQQYFSLPTMQILCYHGKNHQQEICLAFYLSNFITLNLGNYRVHYPVMVEGSGLRQSTSLKHSKHRLRDALRVLYALEHLEQDGWVKREPHEDIDRILAIEYTLQDCSQTDLSEETYERITTTYSYIINDFTGSSDESKTLENKRRELLQHLLSTTSNNAITFKASTLLKKQSAKLAKARTQTIQHEHEHVTLMIEAAITQKNRKIGTTRRKTSPPDGRKYPP